MVFPPPPYPALSNCPLIVYIQRRRQAPQVDNHPQEEKHSSQNVLRPPPLLRLLLHRWVGCTDKLELCVSIRLGVSCTFDDGALTKQRTSSLSGWFGINCRLFLPCHTPPSSPKPRPRENVSHSVRSKPPYPSIHGASCCRSMCAFVLACVVCSTRSRFSPHA